MIPLVEDDQGEGIKDFYEEGPENLALRFRKAEAVAMQIQQPQGTIQKRTEDQMLIAILDRITALEHKFDRVFGNHALINGQFKSLCFEPDRSK
jgi:hypothetical protein